MHLYLHIPFCHEICPYCSFYKHKPGNLSQNDFITALLTELKWCTTQYDLTSVSTLYIGGGTPSLLSRKHLEALFTGIYQLIPTSGLKEITLEANPSTFKLRKAELMKELGVTRVSLGVQSFAPDQLKILGRDHSKEQAIDSYHLLREARIPAVNLDLMFSTPGQTFTSWKDTLTTAITLKPDHLSCYNLTYEEDTAYFQKFITGEYTDEPEINESLFTLADSMLEQHGYTHYETSNYALDGNESLHNKAYWRGNNYLGIGPSAVGCINRVRRKNVSDTAQYIKQIHAVKHALAEQEILDEDAWRLERLALELRTIEGVALEYVNPELLAPLLENEFVTQSGNRLTTTKRGACLVDSIVEYLA